MRTWLATVRAPKYLRYLFFIAYSWYRRYKKERLFAEDNAIIFLGALHLCIFSGNYFCFIGSENRLSIFGFVALMLIQQYIWFWYKKKWRSYIDEFKYVKIKEQKKGLWYLLAYAILCVTLGFFPIIVYLIFDIRL